MYVFHKFFFPQELCWFWGSTPRSRDAVHMVSVGTLWGNQVRFWCLCLRNHTVNLVQLRVKKLEKSLSFSQGLRKACTVFFPELVKWPLGHALTCTEGNIFISRKRHWELQWLRAGARLFMLWRRPKASINQKLNKSIFHRGKKKTTSKPKTRSGCQFCISALGLWIEMFAGSSSSALASSCPLGSTSPSPAGPEPSVNPRATLSLTSPKSSPLSLPQSTLSSPLSAISFPPKNVHLLP